MQGIKDKSAWNSGLTKETDSRIKASKPKIRVMVKCDVCGINIEKTPSEVRKHNFCSNKHRGEFMQGKPAWNSGLTKEQDNRIVSGMKGKNHTAKALALIGQKSKQAWAEGRLGTEEHIKNMTLANKGKNLGRKNISKGKTWEEIYGKERADIMKQELSMARKGIVFSESHIENLRTSHLYIRGELASNWQGGKSFEPYSAEFNKHLKREVRDKDNHVCGICKLTEEQVNHTLVIHHVDYNKKNNAKINLISLCRSCHGVTNFNRAYWQEKLEESQFNREEAK